MIFIRLRLLDGREIRAEQPDGVSLMNFLSSSARLFTCEPIEVRAVETAPVSRGATREDEE